MIMLGESKAFSGFSVDNLDKAREFYGKTLGLKVVDNVMGLPELHLKGTNPIILYPKHDHKPATFTVLNFPVAEIDTAVDQLKEKGLVFLQYGGSVQTDEKGIFRSKSPQEGPSIAWFNDPAGNILSVLENP